MSQARDEILGRIRAALRDVPPGHTDGEDVPRDFRRQGEATRAELVERFAHRVGEYKAAVSQVRPDQLTEAIASSCRTRGVARLVVPADLPSGWEPPGIELLRDPGLTNQQLDESD